MGFKGDKTPLLYRLLATFASPFLFEDETPNQILEKRLSNQPNYISTLMTYFQAKTAQKAKQIRPPPPPIAATPRYISVSYESTAVSSVFKCNPNGLLI